MSQRARIIALLAPYFPDTSPYSQKALIKRQIGHFIEGLLIERTPYKATFYVWSLLSPSWTTRDILTLNYSRRIANSAFFKGSPQEVADFVVSTLISDETASSRCQGKASDLAHFFASSQLGRRGAEFIQRHNELFDYATLLALDGQVEASQKAFEIYVSRIAKPEQARLEDAQRIMAALKRDTATVACAINEIEQRGLDVLGLQPPVWTHVT